MLLLALVLTACTGPVKPVPTQQSQEAPSSPAPETVAAPKPAEPAPSEPPASLATAPPLPVPPHGAAPPSGSAKTDETPELETQPVLVTAQRESYTVQQSATATKTDTPIMETPVSIQVVPRAVIEDQKITRLQEGLENVSGVRPFSSLGLDSNFIIRGFPNRNRTYRNGLGIIGGSAFGSFDSVFDTANIENIEVLKGPAAVLYGRNEPGGLVNINTKRPLDVPYYSLEQRFGSYAFYRTEWDATGPITSGRSLLFRFAGGYQNNGSFRDFVSTDRILVNPSITWKPTEAFEFTLEVEGLKQDHKADFGLPVIGTRPAPIPISRSFDDPNTPLSKSSHVLVGTNLAYHFNKDWTLRSRFLTTHADSNSTFINPVGLRADNRTLDRNIFSQELKTRAYTTNLDLTGHFAVGPTKHRVLSGFDYTLGYTDYGRSGDFIFPNPALAIDIFNPAPSYGIPQSVFDSTLATAVFPGTRFSVAKVQWYGVYFQDQVTLWDKLHILGGGRYDWAERGRGFDPLSFGTAADKLDATIVKDEEFSPRVGVLYEALSWLSVYGNWTKSFGANNGTNAANQLLPPEKGEQYEAGVKTELFDGRLRSTLAVYQLTKQNILTPDTGTLNPSDFIAVGQARSQGVEFDITGQIIENLSVIASYAYTDARVTRDYTANQGHRLINVPRHGGSVWLRYDFRNYEALNGLSLGFGSYMVGQRMGDLENTFLLPGYVRLDAFAAYRWRIGPTKVTASFNIRNLLNKEYYESTDPGNVLPRFGIYPGAPLTAIGSVRVEF
jgi:iron complex outermembrane receptor protein